MLRLEQLFRALILIILAYISGSFLSAYFIPKWFYRKDIVIGSEDGNPGTYNAFKQAGVPCGILVLLLELSKGFVPVFYGKQFVNQTSVLFVALMMAPVFGHGFSCFYKGQGGKGIAVSFGVLLALIPEWRPVLSLAFFYILFSTIVPISSHKKRSILTYLIWGSMIPLLIKSNSIRLACVGIAVIVIAKHVDWNRLGRK